MFSFHILTHVSNVFVINLKNLHPGFQIADWQERHPSVPWPQAKQSTIRYIASNYAVPRWYGTEATSRREIEAGTFSVFSHITLTLYKLDLI